MATRTIECGECGESVPYGRLSCPACGALLAAVTRASSSTAQAAGRRHAQPRNGRRRSPSRGPRARAVPGARRPVRLRRRSISSIPHRTSWTSPPPSCRRRPGRRSSSASRLAPRRRDPPPSRRPTRRLVARPYRTRLVCAGPMTRPGVPPPGAYLPPSPAASIALTAVSAGPPRRSAAPASPDPAGATSATVRAALPSLDAARVGELAGWLVAAGSAMAALGFLLPWSVAVIGARGYGGYLDGWGLASPTHVLALAACCSRWPWGSSRRPSRPGCEPACSGSRSAACSSG